MIRTDINASLYVASMGYDAATETLEIEWSTGRIFDYSPIPSDDAAVIAALDEIDDRYFRALARAQHLTATEVTE